MGIGGNGSRDGRGYCGDCSFARESAESRIRQLNLEDRQMSQHAEIREINAELARDRRMLGEALAALAYEVKALSDKVVDLAEAITTA